MSDWYGFVLLDSEWQLIFADEGARAALAPEAAAGPDSPGSESAMRDFAAEVARRMAPPDAPKTFEYAGRNCTLLPFSCGHAGKTDRMNGVLLGPQLGSCSYIAPFSRMFRLTPRETQTLNLCLRGLSAKEIGEELGISVHTAKAFLRTLGIKMGVASRAEMFSKLWSHVCEASLTCPLRVVAAKAQGKH